MGRFAIWDTGGGARWRLAPQLYIAVKIKKKKKERTNMVFTHTHTPYCPASPRCLSISQTHTCTEKGKAVCPATISTFAGVLARPSLSPLMSLMTPNTPSPLRLAPSPSPTLSKCTLIQWLYSVFWCTESQLSILIPDALRCNQSDCNFPRWHVQLPCPGEERMMGSISQDFTSLKTNS